MEKDDSANLYRPRLLIILNRFVVGGHISDTIPLVYHLQADFEILILYGTKKPDEIEAFYLLEKYPGLNIKKIPSLKRNVNPFVDVLALSQVIREVRRFKPDVIHTHGAKPGLLGRLAGFFCHTSVVIHTFHGHFFHSYYGHLLSNVIITVEKLLAKITTRIIATSQQQWNDLVLHYKIASAEKVDIIHLGIEEDFYNGDQSESAKSFRKKYDLEGLVAIGIIARITKIKNFLLFTEVVSQVLCSTTTDVKFIVIGDGELKHDVQHQLSLKKIDWSNEIEYDPKSKVIFTSWIIDVSKVISGLDIVILTSDNEGTGLSLVEAQLLSKPVVATKVGGVEDSLINGETGFFSEPNNARQFANKLSVLINDAELRERMGKNAARFAKAKFSKQTEIEKFRELYNSLIKRSKIS